MILKWVFVVRFVIGWVRLVKLLLMLVLFCVFMNWNCVLIVGVYVLLFLGMLCRMGLSMLFVVKVELVLLMMILFYVFGLFGLMRMLLMLMCRVVVVFIVMLFWKVRDFGDVLLSGILVGIVLLLLVIRLV